MMEFKLGGKSMSCPDTIGNWTREGIASDGTSPFYKRHPPLPGMGRYDHITIPWGPDGTCDGHIHYTTRGLTFAMPSNTKVYKFGFAVSNSSGPTETSRGGKNEDRPIFSWVSDALPATRTGTQVKNDASALMDWKFTKTQRKIMNLVQEFWQALLALQPPPPPMPRIVRQEVPASHRLYDLTYHGLPSGKPGAVVPARPLGDFEQRLRSSLEGLKRIAEQSGLRVFVLGSKDESVWRQAVCDSIHVAEILAKEGYRLRITPFLEPDFSSIEVRIHFH